MQGSRVADQQMASALGQWTGPPNFKARPHSSEVSWFWSVVCSNFWKKYFFKETCAIMPPTRRFGSKNRNSKGFFPGKEIPKTIFGQRWSTLLHNLRLMTHLMPHKKD
jgi:hypothetical protein